MLRTLLRELMKNSAITQGGKQTKLAKALWFLMHFPTTRIKPQKDIWWWLTSKDHQEFSQIHKYTVLIIRGSGLETSDTKESWNSFSIINVTITAKPLILLHPNKPIFFHRTLISTIRFWTNLPIQRNKSIRSAICVRALTYQHLDLYSKSVCKTSWSIADHVTKRGRSLWKKDPVSGVTLFFLVPNIGSKWWELTSLLYVGNAERNADRRWEKSLRRTKRSKNLRVKSNNKSDWILLIYEILELSICYYVLILKLYI